MKSFRHYFVSPAVLHFPLPTNLARLSEIPRESVSSNPCSWVWRRSTRNTWPDRHAEKVPEALAGVAALVQQQEVREGAVAGGRGVGKVPQPIELGRVQYVVDDCHLR